MNQVGSAIHAFLAADPLSGAEEPRVAIATELLSLYGLTGVIRPDLLLVAHDTLKAWLDTRYPGARWRREVPIVGAVASPTGARQARGAIDLLLETDEGWVIVDHKTYPGGDFEAKARGFLPQLAAYGKLLEAEGSRPVLTKLVHFPIGGTVAECS
jgi:ATP-dependent exoDNAse (exonuclease V) beta subunit